MRNKFKIGDKVRAHLYEEYVGGGYVYGTVVSCRFVRGSTRCKYGVSDGREYWGGDLRLCTPEEIKQYFSN